MANVRITGGVGNTLTTVKEGFSATVEKTKLSKIEVRVDIPEKLVAPVVKGQKIGTVTYLEGGKEIGTADILAAHSVDKITFSTLFPRLLAWFLMGEKI